ncbi:helix-turn-helix domain-containing protein [Kitasatospora sp. NPDC101183]|uniref:helix-turn-helix domain-containing protein n=1 Tax=Kitasatospora sp. NPDC101183 TaxID=3364100 RepID=UPI0037F88EDE
MSGETGTAGTEGAAEFARLLSGLKERSGLSYGTLAKRLHMSTSTLHRYCNGTAVPTEFSPVERMARACRATPEELVELHRQWILADSGRGRRAAAVARPASASDQASGEIDRSAAVEVRTAPGSPRRRRTALIASVAAVVVLAAAVVLAIRPAPKDGGGTAVAPAVATTSASEAPSAAAEPPPAPTQAQAQTPSPTATTTTPEADDGPAPITVRVRPYVYSDPCSQHFLVHREPGQVGPPAAEQDARSWAAKYGAVSSDEQLVALTAQGTGADTVVLNALNVRIVSKSAPLAWNDYAMGNGCGGGVESKAFDVDLDRGSPTATASHGQRPFPYKVSESDPEVFYVTAHTKAHDVRWELSIDWSSGTRHGVLRVDDSGTSFRTSSATGRPGYDSPPGGPGWTRRTVG